MEVVVAVAVFAGAIVAVIGMLGPSLRATREVLDSAVAARLAAVVDGELEVLGFDAVESLDEIEAYATIDGSYIVAATEVSNPENPRASPDPIVQGLRPGIAAERRYFRIVISKVDQPPATAAFEPRLVRVEWPYLYLVEGEDSFSGAEARVRAEVGSSFTFVTAMRR
ncbi:hypothetical protein ASA1KI_19800 [Opitutales bacterium ASA1]|uniref:hypothetical protein n=1 Tax=Congregicoccus parvus TaxID=3081749 RepID=UPI002B3082BF|nr:hypothetical protein ASA1KI_19800 [Opitutales bacterium ASA1]